MVYMSEHKDRFTGTLHELNGNAATFRRRRVNITGDGERQLVLGIGNKPAP